MNPKCLIVDDSKEIRDSLKRFLSRRLECTTAEDGDIAYDLFLKAIQQQDPFKLVILDIKMPNMDGVDVLKNIRKKENELGISNGSKTHVVMASGVENKDVKEVCYEQGCSYYFEKPLNLSHVGILIKSIISERMK